MLWGGAHVETIGVNEGLELGVWHPERVYGMVGGTRWVGGVSVMWAEMRRWIPGYDVLIQQPFLMRPIRKFVQHPLQKRFDLTGWYNRPYRTPPGSMWFQIVVSLKFYRPLYIPRVLTKRITVG